MLQLPGITERQRAGYIPSHAKDSIRKGPGGDLIHGRHQRGKQRHLDQHVPADPVRMPIVPHLVAAHDIRMILCLCQMRVFLHDSPEIVFVTPGKRSSVVSFAEQLFDLAFLPGDRNKLQRGFFNALCTDLLDLIDSPVIALADQTDRFPSRPFHPVLCC